MAGYMWINMFKALKKIVNYTYYIANLHSSVFLEKSIHSYKIEIIIIEDMLPILLRF